MKTYVFDLNTQDEPGCNICGAFELESPKAVADAMLVAALDEFKLRNPDVTVKDTVFEYEVNYINAQVYVHIVIKYI